MGFRVRASRMQVSRGPGNGNSLLDSDAAAIDNMYETMTLSK